MSNVIRNINIVQKPLRSAVSETYFSDSVSRYDPYVSPDSPSKQVWWTCDQ